MAKNYSYSKTISPMIGDALWQIKDNALTLGGVVELVDSFIISCVVTALSFSLASSSLEYLAIV